MSLIYECCADLGITDRVGDLIQKKLQSFQAAQVARQLQAQNLAVVSPRIKKPTVLDQKPDEGFICGSSAFQELAGFSSSYEGQVRAALESLSSELIHDAMSPSHSLACPHSRTGRTRELPPQEHV